MKKTFTTLLAITVLCFGAFAMPADADAHPAGWVAALVGGVVITTAVIAAAQCAYGCQPPPRIGIAVPSPAPWPGVWCAPRPVYWRHAYPPVVRVVPRPHPIR